MKPIIQKIGLLAAMLLTVVTTVVLSGCSKESVGLEIVFWSDLGNGNSRVEYTVSAEGGTVNVGFNANTDWRLESTTYLDYRPDHGSKGEHRVYVSVPPNPEYKPKTYEFTFWDVDGDRKENDYFGFLIQQEPTYFIDCPENIELDYNQTSASIPFMANGDCDIYIPQSWLDATTSQGRRELNGLSNYELLLTFEPNNLYIDRTATIRLELGYKEEKKINVIQKGRPRK